MISYLTTPSWGDSRYLEGVRFESGTRLLSMSYTRDLANRHFIYCQFFSLEDVDECAENNTLCGSLHCANLPGSFQCLGKCDVGFKRTMDDKECVGKMYV